MKLSGCWQLGEPEETKCSFTSFRRSEPECNTYSLRYTVQRLAIAPVGYPQACHHNGDQLLSGVYTFQRLQRLFSTWSTSWSDSFCVCEPAGTRGDGGGSGVRPPNRSSQLRGKTQKNLGWGGLSSAARHELLDQSVHLLSASWCEVRFLSSAALKTISWTELLCHRVLQ